MKKALFLLTFLAIISIFSFAKAEGQPVVINEIMWMGSSASIADEWIELKNTTSFDIDISNWQIEGAGSSGGNLAIPDGKWIPANGFFVISNYASSSSKSILLNEHDYITTSISLKNDNLALILKDNKRNIIDQIGTDDGDPFAGNNDNKWSMERTEDFGDGTKSKAWYTCTEGSGIKPGFLDLGTPGFINSKDLSRDIVDIKDSKLLNREVTIQGVVVVLPDTLFDARIYVFDGKSGIRVYLEKSKWPDLKAGDRIKVRGSIQTYYAEKEIKIVDDSDVEILVNGDKIIPTLISTGGYHIYEGALVKVIGKITQTSGDTFYIDDGSGEIKIYIKDELNITLPNKGVGDTAEIIGILNNWSGAFRILPNKLDDIKISRYQKVEEAKAVSISEAKKQVMGTKVRIYGKVIVAPNRLGKTIFYIQDENNGIQVYSWYKDFPLLVLGDWIEVLGEMSMIGGEARVKISLATDIKVVEKRIAEIPQKIVINNAANYLGRLIKVKGTITKSSGNTLFINDGTGEIKIYIKRETGIKKPKTKKGDIIEVSGIVSITDSGLRILPRHQNDFNLVWSKPPKGKILKASTYKRPELNKEETILKAIKMPPKNNFIFVIIGGVLLLGASVLYLKNVILNK